MAWNYISISKQQIMKKSISFIIGFIGLGLASCVDYSDEATAISAKIQVVAPQEFTAGDNLSGRTVTLSNATGPPTRPRPTPAAWPCSTG